MCYNLQYNDKTFMKVAFIAGRLSLIKSIVMRVLCTYCYRCDADSGEHLFNQSVAIIERLHHQTLLSGCLGETERNKAA